MRNSSLSIWCRDSNQGLKCLALNISLFCRKAKRNLIEQICTNFSSLMFYNVKLFSQKWSTFILKDFTDEILLMYKNVPPQVWFKSFWSTTLTKIIVTYQRPLNYFVRGSITIRLTSCLFSLDSATLLLLN